MLVLACYAVVVWRAFHRDSIWWNKVQKELNPEDARRWALNAMTFYNTNLFDLDFKTWLTNAPAPLLNNYERGPQVIVQDDGTGKASWINLRYGGGMYDWGLTIGATNLESRWARGRHIEMWAPGIYFWSN